MSSYYVPLPSAEMPRNALLDFSPIRQAMIDRRNMENQAYERQRQLMLDQRALDNQAFERNMQTERLNLSKAENAREERKSRLPQYQTIDGSVLAFDNDRPFSPRTVYQAPNPYDDIVGKNKEPSNALIPPARNYSFSPSNVEFSFEPPKTANDIVSGGAHSMFRSPTLSSASPTSSSTPVPTVEYDNHNWTQEEIGRLKASRNPAARATGEHIEKLFEEKRKQTTFESPVQQASVTNVIQDNVKGALQEYEITKNYWNNIKQAAQTYDDPTKTDTEKGVADVALIRGYLKIIDPKTRYNPADPSSLADAPPLIQEAMQFLKTLQRGGKLSDGTRNAIINMATSAFKEYVKENEKRIVPFRNMGDALKIPRNQYEREGLFPTDEEYLVPRNANNISTTTDPSKIKIDEGVPVGDGWNGDYP